MFINNFIYFYIGICIAIVLFELTWSQYIKIHNFYYKKKKEEYMEIISKYPECRKKKTIKKLSKELENIDCLIAFQSALEESEEKKKVNKFINYISPVFMYLNDYYLETKKYTEKAYFAYFIGKNIKSNYYNKQLKNIILNTMYNLIRSKYIYCISNAMIVTFNIGNVTDILKAVHIINSNEISYHNNLLTDNLKKFNGNKELLVKKLFENFDDYNENIQIAIIKFLKEYKYIDEEKLLEKLKNPKLSVNVRCELMRYFEINKNENAKKYLILVLSIKEIKVNDFIIKAIGTLGYYNDEEVITLFKILINIKNEIIEESVYKSMENLKMAS